MKKNAVITTYYCKNCDQPTKETLKTRFNYDGNTEDFFINFSNDFDPWNIESIPYVGPSRRKDLVFGKIFKLKTFIENHILGKYENILHHSEISIEDAKKLAKMILNY